MPVITVNRKDFCELLGKKLSMKEIEEKLPMLGVAWESSEKNEFTIEVNPNRPDMLSVEGLARAFSSFLGIKTGLREYKAEKSIYLVSVTSSVKAVRPFIVCAVVKGLELTDPLIKSLMQLQEKLHVSHGRKRRKASIGVYDLDKITFPITYTSKPPTFKFIPLEEKKEMSLDEILKETPKGKEFGWILEGKTEYPVLIDASNEVLSMPPIINSENKKVDENTKNLFIDVTGTDEKTVNEILNIIVTSLADRGGKIYEVKIRYPDRTIETPNLEIKTMNLNPSYVNKLLGLNLSNYEMIEYLRRMGFEAIELNRENIEVMIPCYRTDIMHAMDLVEEIAIAYGYDKFEPEIPKISTIGEEDPLEVFCSRLRNLLVGYGLQEVVTFILTNKKNLFEKMLLKEERIAETANPKTEEYSVVRNRLLPSLMEVLWRNRHREYPQRIFEIGDVVELDEVSDTGAVTKRKLAIALCHSKASFSETKSLIESFLINIGLKNYELEESDTSYFIPGRAAKILVDKRCLGEFGEIRPEVLENWELEIPVSACEISVDLLFNFVK